MKKFQYILFFLIPIITIAQSKSVVNDTLVYNSSGVEKEPEFPGGIKEFYKYIGENFNLPNDKNFKGGKIFTSFVIEKDGSVTDVKVLREIGFGTSEEAIRVLKGSPFGYRLKTMD